METRAGAPADTAGPGRFELDLYLYGVRVGLALARAGRFNRAVRYLIQPVPYWRSLEYRLVWDAARFRSFDRVLDVGSPKLLSLFLAERVGAEVHSTDLEPYFLDEYTYLRRVRHLSPGRFHVETADGRALPYADGAFTKVYAISVVEHIPEAGDGECLREIARVLAPGGSCFLTVPFWPTSRDVYRKPNFYWAGSVGEAKRQGDAVFFQRRYSAGDLDRRLIEPSGLQVTRRLYVGERLMVRNRQREFSERLPVVSSPIHPLLSRLVHTRPTERWQELEKPLCAFLQLTKPVA
jgi:SAM-dependent methyltransferase